MTQHAPIHAYAMGDFVGAHEPKREFQDNCPECGGLKARSSRVCVFCRVPRPVQKSEDAMDRHHRWSACLEAGWTMEELIAMRPFLFEWEHIVKFAPDVVIKRWWRRG